MDSLDDKSPVSLYFQLKEIFIKKILNKEWQLGSKIPSEYDLCCEYQVSRITVRQALSELDKEGYIIRRRGKGTFVSVPKIDQSLMSFYSFSKEFMKKGFEPHIQVLEFHLEIPRDVVKKNLELEGDNQWVYYIKRLRYADNILIAIESTYLPADLFPNLKEEDVKEKALYDIMRDIYGVVPNSAEESIGAALISENESVFFGMKKGAAAIDLERLTYSNKRCIEYTKGIVRGDKFRFRVKLK